MRVYGGLPKQLPIGGVHRVDVSPDIAKERRVLGTPRRPDRRRAADTGLRLE